MTNAFILKRERERERAGEDRRHREGDVRMETEIGGVHAQAEDAKGCRLPPERGHRPGADSPGPARRGRHFEFRVLVP